MKFYKFSRAIRPYVQTELQLARKADSTDEPTVAFGHLERAHVLGQSSTIEHVRVHSHMAAWAVRQRSPREFLGQLLRIIGAATKTAVGFLPYGNTGGSNVSPFKRMPVSPELEELMQRARSSEGQSGVVARTKDL